MSVAAARMRMAAAGASYNPLMAYHQDWPAWGSWTPSVSPSSPGLYRYFDTTALGAGAMTDTPNGVDGSYVEYQINVDAGTYTVKILHRVALRRGIVRVSIDGVSLGTYDGYAAGASANFLAAFSGATLNAGVHTVRLAAEGKNVAATSYALAPQWLSLDRTGA